MRYAGVFMCDGELVSLVLLSYKFLCACRSMANWDRIQQRGRVEDRRMNKPVMIGGGLGMLALAVLFTLIGGGDVSQVLETLPQESDERYSRDTSEYAGEDSYELYVKEVTGSANALWSTAFEESGLTYREPTTVLFRGSTTSACGGANAAVGPHYCPADETIYLDETFFDELTTQFGARGGDVAEAYVLAHEMGHHVQTLLGAEHGSTNEDSIAFELQADCYAGVWANSVADEGIITQEEVDQAIDAAAAVGDDRIQQKTSGRVDRESWTHGSSAQRKHWFLTGFTTGDPTQCDTSR
jgi:uncharacterized protein